MAKEHKVYVLPLLQTRKYIWKKYPHNEERRNDFILYVDEEMPEKECKEIVENSENAVAGVYTLREFQAGFNFALEDKEITSQEYLIKIF